jgi:hypothetical protein
MNRRVVAIAILAGLAVLVVLRAASAEPASLWSDMDLSSGSPSTDAVVTSPSAPPISLAPLGQGEPSSWDIGWVLQLILAALAAGVVALVLWWLSTRQWGRTQRDRPGEFGLLPEIEVDLTEAAEGLDDVLSRGSPRNAIVACWVGLEDAVEQAGLRRDPTETSEEMVTRVLRTYTLDHDAITTLAWLYREARFSVHDLDEGHRQQAQAALAALREQLRATADVETEVAP